MSRKMQIMIMPCTNRANVTSNFVIQSSFQISVSFPNRGEMGNPNFEFPFLFYSFYEVIAIFWESLFILRTLIFSPSLFFILMRWVIALFSILSIATKCHSRRLLRYQPVTKNIVIPINVAAINMFYFYILFLIFVYVIFPPNWTWFYPQTHLISLSLFWYLSTFFPCS
jgi:hypothetical protein